MASIKFNDYLSEQLKNPDFKKGFETEDSKLKSAVALFKAREEAGLSQRELAQLASLPQSTIARVERGDNTSFDTLSKIAYALGKKLEVNFI
ncbi:helix-turn-helix domain-containing protein [Enterococcus timonensis]|uniref:helix-turn-helix domain-containing protein n=1 Tax=Enterococcus timonensis TaxID=1852364 RepID=UPI0008DA4EDE|nr:helix-turn-helix transcriptional regulator [Enterococcus timonensis]